jgi:hypothetical protein
MGEMGGVFARGLLKLGYPVYPISREMNLARAEREAPDPEVVVVAVGEKDLPVCLQSIPKAWRNRIVLLQNELLPKDWRLHGIAEPTVISAWFEKKWPQDYKVIVPSVVFGPQAHLIHEALGALKIPCRVLPSADELLIELVVKNLYILTVNIAGLEVGGTVGELWSRHNALARSVANDVLDIQFSLIGKRIDCEQLIQKMVQAFEGDPKHQCMGRAAPQRLERALALAQEAGVSVKTLREISARQGKTVMSS